MARRALIVDDQPDIRKLIMMTMESENFELHEAENGEIAWLKAQQLRPALILLDVMMPGRLDGYQVCEKVKADPELASKTKVILLTARGQKTDVERGHEAGCDAYLVKPFSPIELLDTVDRLVP
ncbi:response regulator [Rhodoferax sp. OV413]|uniref:response regulator transcription factor n=1 Tax=Rhodoferax sp. OV413 TaxID=1855285 RepID=UPI0025E86BD1|nr:response regulator [Rhodoferax sp. OV413]